MSNIGGIGSAPSYSGADFESVLGEQDAGASHLQEQSAPSETGATQSSRPFRLQNLSEIGMIPPDLDSPVTPDDDDELGKSLLAQYADPTALPGPTAELEDRVVYGSVLVPKDKAEDYQAVRQHMAEGGARSQKYLAALENRERDDRPIEVYPYKGSAPIPRLDGKEPLPAKTQFFNEPHELITTFSTDRALFHLNGTVTSPATAAAHELAHAVRAGEITKHSLAGWTDTEEHHVITKLEHEVALAHGEGIRDSHLAVGMFRTESITSTVPATPLTQGNIELARPALERQTQSMDELGLGAIHEDHPVVADRIAKARNVEVLD
ncbi:MAG TPA: hypothetical protein VK638_15250 [Edaphobacter sp.]|nr:hypothetical protein [Edaphobacter sp.]